MLQDAVGGEVKAMEEVLDLLLRWTVLRLCET